MSMSSVPWMTSVFGSSTATPGTVLLEASARPYDCQDMNGDGNDAHAGGGSGGRLPPVPPDDLDAPPCHRHPAPVPLRRRDNELPRRAAYAEPQRERSVRGDRDRGRDHHT